jgi:predicted CopG family antitoxin
MKKDQQRLSKNIRIFSSLGNRLSTIKINLNFKSLSDVVEKLLEKCGGIL